MPESRAKQLHSDRETAILLAAQGLLRNKGSFAMRIQDIAKEADISVGTFYGHFESKEDLTMALMALSTDERCRCLQETREHVGFGPVPSLITGLFRNYLFAIDHTGLFAAEELAAFSSVWELAPDERLKQVQQALENLSKIMLSMIKDSIKADSITEWDKDKNQVRNLNNALWFLFTGSNVVYKTQRLIVRETSMQRRIPHALQASLQALLVGFGWQHENPSSVISECAQVALDFEVKSSLGR